jgi:ABC-2 type transport system permease protein
MKRVWSQCQKEWLQILRDPLTLALAFILPLMTLLIFGFAIRLEAQNIPVAAQDWDLSPLSRSYLTQIYTNNRLQPVAWSGSDPIEPLQRGIAQATLVIPPHFGRQLSNPEAQGQPVPVQVLIDGSDVNNARILQNTLEAATQFFLREQGLVPGSPPIQPQVRLWFNPGRKESLFIVSGVFALVLAVYPPLLMEIALVREKEKGTILQIYASSLTALEFLAGKALATMGLSLAISLVVMSLGSLLFAMPLVGDPLPFLLGTPLFIFTTVSFGLMIGSLASNQIAAVQALANIGFLTSLLLSGFIYPLSNIPFPMVLISNVVPARYYLELVRDAFVRGTGWAGVWFVFPILSGLGLLFFGVAWLSLRRMQVPD